MNNLLTFDEFLNEAASSTPTNILDAIYERADKDALKKFIKQHKKNFKFGGIIYIHGKIEGSLAVESRYVDAIFASEEEDMPAILFSRVDEVIGSRSTNWKSEETKRYPIRNLEKYMDENGLDSFDWTDTVLVIYQNPDWHSTPKHFNIDL